MKTKFILLLLLPSFIQAQSHVALLGVNNVAIADFAEADPESDGLSFDMVNGMAIVKASVDGQEGNFILDTGAPGIVLNAQPVEDDGSLQAAGLGGGMNVSEVEVKNFRWGIIRKANAKAIQLDISHLEKLCSRNIMGLIGFDVLKNYEVFFDYRQQTVHIFAGGDQSISTLRPTLTIPFVLCGHVPVFKAVIGGQKVRLGLDSGAEVNLLNASVFAEMAPEEMSNIEEELLTGLNQVAQSVMAADLRTTAIRNEMLPEMRFLFSDLTQLRQSFGMDIDGLLGYPFFKNRVISIDYRKKQIRIWQ